MYLPTQRVLFLIFVRYSFFPIDGHPGLSVRDERGDIAGVVLPGLPLRELLGGDAVDVAEILRDGGPIAVEHLDVAVSLRFWCLFSLNCRPPQLVLFAPSGVDDLGLTAILPQRS